MVEEAPDVQFLSGATPNDIDTLLNNNANIIRPDEDVLAVWCSDANLTSTYAVSKIPPAFFCVPPCYPCMPAIIGAQMSIHDNTLYFVTTKRLHIVTDAPGGVLGGAAAFVNCVH